MFPFYSPTIPATPRIIPAIGRALSFKYSAVLRIVSVGGFGILPLPKSFGSSSKKFILLCLPVFEMPTALCRLLSCGGKVLAVLK